tara:strand:+ start:454 stop:822 length:369 start_codon:yes stop_codon:yes gene_type:complete
MQINKEPRSKHTIESYSDTEIKINGEIYRQNILISKDAIIQNWTEQKISKINSKVLSENLHPQVEILIIGHEDNHLLPNNQLMQYLSQRRVGFEFMSIGAACRTFNILLSEERHAVLGIIFP